MKKLMCLLAICGVFGSLGGCQVNQQNFNQVVVANEGTIRAASSLATSAAILAVKPEDRVATARTVYEVAAAVNTAATTGTINAAAVDQLVASQLSKLNSSDAVVAGAVIHTVEGLVNGYVSGIFAQATTDEKTQATVVLFASASAGVMDGALVYTNGVPTLPVNPLISAFKPNTIVVKHFDWK